MKWFRNLERKKQAWLAGVAHATLDPDGPGVARMHLVPPKPTLFRDPPSQLIINGMWFLPVGPSWSSLLRVFFQELQHFCREKREINPEEILLIEQAVVNNVLEQYPGTDKEMVLKDLKEVITLAVNIATNQDIPAEALSGFSLEQYSKYMTAPHRMDLIVAPMSLKDTRTCPLQCVCCYADSGELMRVRELLPLEDWKEIIDRCRDAGIPMLTFTGGEPLTRPDITELVRHASWFVTRLNTNAFLLTPELAKALYEASLDGIQITLYSHHAQIHDALVGKEGAFEKTVKGIQNAVEGGLSVSINTPLVQKNRDYGNTLRFIHSLNVYCVTCSSLIPAGGAVEQLENGRALTEEQLKNILQEAVVLTRELNMEISFTSPGWLHNEEARKLNLPSLPVCGACLSNMAIAPNGQVVPCQSWLNGQTLGDIRKEPWHRIWNQKKCKKIRGNYALKSNCALKGVVM